MQLFFIFFSIAVLSPVLSLHYTEVVPVQKVLQMMSDMLVKSKKAQRDEQVRYSEYEQFCQSTHAGHSHAVMDGKFQIKQMNVAISEETEDVTALESQIAFLTEDIDELSSQKAMNQEYRSQEHAHFSAVHQKYISAIDLVNRTLQVLASSPGQSFAQVKDSLVALKALDLNNAEILPETYELSSRDAVTMFQGLGEKFKEEKYELEEDEARQKDASNMFKQDLQSSIDKSNKELYDKIATKEQWEKAKDKAQGSLRDVTVSLGADAQYLADITEGCRAKGLEYKERQSVLSTEINALVQAIEIMSGSAVATGSKHLPTLAQKETSSAQFHSVGQRSMQKQVARFLADRAGKVSSQILSFVAACAAKDPFPKVKKMIQNEVLKLMEEALDEDEQKGYCDTDIIQTRTNQNKYDKKIEKAQNASAFVEELTAFSTKLESEAEDLSEQISELDSAMAQATNFRSEEKVHNAVIVADAQAASVATAQARQVLNDFYSHSDASVAQCSVNTSVVGMLKVVESAFVRLETETQVVEDRAEKDYNAFMRNSSQVKAVKLNEKTSKQGHLKNNVHDFNGTQGELDRAISYFKKLQTSYIHVEAGESHEERVMRREEEIRSLKDALKMF